VGTITVVPNEVQHSERQLSQRFSWTALTLAIVAGSTDGIGYLLLTHIFTSHMSGNTVAQTLYVASGQWREAWRHFEPIVVFFFGIVIGLIASDALTSAKIARMFAVVASMEAALLLAFVFLAHPAQQWMVVFPAGAMGIQNAMLRRVGHHRVRTTFVTGMLTNAAQGLVEAVGARLTRAEDAREKLSDFYFYGAIWLLFALGGIAGAFIELTFGSSALWLPVAALLVLIGCDLIAPFAAAPASNEEQGSAA
jgi:uncharacterized membrane protein YoaK (UPF0700 family)